MLNQATILPKTRKPATFAETDQFPSSNLCHPFDVEMCCVECNQDHPVQAKLGALLSVLYWRQGSACNHGGAVNELAFKRPKKNRVSQDAISWERSKEYWEEKKLAEKEALKARLAAIPAITNGQCSLMDLATEIRQQIISYILDWEDVRCVETSRTEFKQWESLPLNDLPFVFHKFPSILVLNRQILCEAVSVLLRKPMVVTPLMRTHGGAQPSIMTKSTIIHPTARLLRLHAFATGEKSIVTPKLVIEVDCSYEVHWQTVHQLLRLWRDGLEFEFLFVRIQKTASFDYSIPEHRGTLEGGSSDATVEALRMSKGAHFTMSSSSWRKLPWPWETEKVAGLPAVRSSLEHALLGPVGMSASLREGEQLKLRVLMPSES